jgi:hypothetical protein
MFTGKRTGGSTLLLAPLGRVVNITTALGHSCALLANGGVSCWGANEFGQVGIGSSASLVLTASALPSFTLNIDPTVTFDRNGRVADVTVVATCEAGRRLLFDVSLTQGEASGRGSGTGKCTGQLERYPVTVPAQGRDSFLEGAAEVSAEGAARDGGVVVDVQEWTRQVNIVSPP